VGDVSGPILIRCEGSGGDGIDGTMIGEPLRRMCQMCGLPFRGNGRIPEHDRDDILARIDRGDFG
jgi:hypothetical protein